MRRQPIIDQPRRLLECASITELPGAQLRPLHALARRAALARPTSSGTFDKSELTPQQLGVTTSQVRTAGQACQHLLPYNGGATQAEAQQLMNSMRNFARCMRSHGVSNWPDPVPDQHLGGLPGFPRNMPGINQNSPRITTDIDGCRHLIPGASGLPPGGYP
jgi:hypothetical protein